MNTHGRRDVHGATTSHPNRPRTTLKTLTPLTYLTLACALSACGFQTQTRTVSMQQATSNPNATRMTNFMDAPNRFGSPSEDTPGGIARAAVIDEARISELSGDRVCFDVVVRTHVDLDVPLSQWKVKLNPNQDLYFQEGPITVADYPFDGERVVFAADAVLPEAFGSLRLTEPTNEVFRVYERSGSVCGANPGTATLTLTLTNPQDDLRGDWGETYTWTLR